MESGLDPYNTAYADSTDSVDRRAERELLWHHIRRNDTVHNNSCVSRRPARDRVSSRRNCVASSDRVGGRRDRVGGAADRVVHKPPPTPVAHRQQTNARRALDPNLLAIAFGNTDLLGKAGDRAVGDLLFLGTELLDELCHRPNLRLAGLVVELL